MSHSSSPRRGASADNVNARVSRLVIWPSCSNKASGRPAARGSKRAPRSATTSSAIVLSGATPDCEVLGGARAHTFARAAHRLADSQDRAAHAALDQQARESRRRLAVPGQRENSRSGCRCGMIASSARPCSDSGAQSCRLQPSRAAASENAEGAGRQMILRREMPPEQGTDAEEEGIAAREHAGRLAAPREQRGNGVLDRRGPGSVAAEIGEASARCRVPPTTRAACAMRAVRQEKARRGRPRRCRRGRARRQPGSLAERRPAG